MRGRRTWTPWPERFERFRNRLRRGLVLVAMIAFAAFIAYEILVALIR